MRISCEVQVNNRKLPSLSLSNRRRSCQSSLGIGRPPGSPADVSSLFIQLCTAQNRQGTKYKVAGNIQTVFTKFVAEGKFTIRFTEPEVDLCVKADPVLAKSFLHTLKAGMSNKNIDKLHLSNLAPAKQSQLEKLKTNMVILKKAEYPITTGFPYSLEELKVNKVELNRVENRMMKLKRLKTLDLSCNLLKTLPPAMSQMACLAHLHLRSNQLSHIPHQLFSGSLTHNLITLDLSHNMLKYLPHTLGNLRNLMGLRLNSNCLVKLPLSLGKLTNLRCLSVSNNKLVELPASVRRLRLNALEVCDNPFSTPLGLVTNNLCKGVPRLKEIVSVYCVKKGMSPTASDIPATLVDYLSSWYHCNCGRPCFESVILACIPLDLERLSTSIVLERDFRSTVPAMATLCSLRCWEFCRKR